MRRAHSGDARALARVQRAARTQAVGMPLSVHSETEDVQFAARRIAKAEVWVFEREARVCAYVDLDALPDSTDARGRQSCPGWLHSLYVAPTEEGSGVGSHLLDLAKGLRPGGFGLYVFAANQGARRFYRRRGLVELEHTDGSDNEEQFADVRMVWPGLDPVSTLRREIDLVDRELAGLLARRMALTAAVQPHKQVPGHAGRDLVREAEIAAHMARRFPSLTPQLARTLMSHIICTALDEWERSGS